MRIPKTALYTGISILVLLVITVAGGVGYVWYSGQQTDVTTEAETVEPASNKPPTPTRPAENARASASVQLLTSPVAPGENVSMYVKTVPTSKCAIKAVYDNVTSNDSGLVEKTADEYGIVTWTWTVDLNVPNGTWPVTVTCQYNKTSAVVVGNLVVKKVE